MRSGGLHSRTGRGACVNGIQGNSLSPAVRGQIGGTIYEPGRGSPQPPNLQVPWCWASNHRIFEKSIPAIAKLPALVFCFVLIAAQQEDNCAGETITKENKSKLWSPPTWVLHVSSVTSHKTAESRQSVTCTENPQQPPTALFVLRQGLSVQP